MTELSAALPLIRVNGQDEPLLAQTVAALLAQREIPTDMRGIAVALNGRVVPRADWPAATSEADAHAAADLNAS